MQLLVYSLPHRYIQRCEAIISHLNMSGSEAVDFPDQEIVDNSTIYVSVDATGDHHVS